MKFSNCGVLAALIFGLGAGELPAKPSEGSENYRRALLFVQTMETLRKHYVDQEKVSYEKLFNHAMRGMLSALDPYSDYETPKDSVQQRISRSGELTGIGVEVVKPDKRMITVIRVMPRSPAEEKGIRAGDQITGIDGEGVRQHNLAYCSGRLRGREGSSVKIKLLRDGKIRELVLVRRKVVRPSIAPDAVKMTAGNVGYIKLENFTAHTPEEFFAALKKLKKAGAKALVLDLRGNPGGLVRSAILVCSALLPGDTVLFRTRERGKTEEKVVRSLGKFTMDTQTPLFLLVNSFSASCSELAAGALQENKRAVVVGMRTFGKGTLLNVVPLKNGGALRYASAHYVTPSGKIIEGKGIQPDTPVAVSSQELFRLASQGMRHPGVVQPAAKGTIRDRQLARAFELARQAAAKRNNSNGL